MNPSKIARRNSSADSKLTLIASYQKDDEIVMIGDLMESAKNNTTTPELPSRFEGGPPIDNPMLSGLIQKIVILTDRIAVAWCGNYLVARNIIQLIQERAETIQKSEECLKVIEDSELPKSELEDVSFIFYVMNCDEERCNVGIQDYLTGQTSAAPRHKVKYAGTGAYHFLETIGFDLRLGRSGATSYEQIIMTWLTRVSIAFLEEINDHTPHNFLYGGGFELLAPMPREKRFIKIPYSTFFWRYGGDYIQLLQIGYSMQYTPGGELVINRFSPKKDSDGGIKRFVVGTPISGSLPTELPPVVLRNPYAVHHFLRESPGSAKSQIWVEGGGNQPLLPSLADVGLRAPSVAPDYLRDLLKSLSENKEDKEKG